MQSALETWFPRAVTVPNQAQDNAPDQVHAGLPSPGRLGSLLEPLLFSMPANDSSWSQANGIVTIRSQISPEQTYVLEVCAVAGPDGGFAVRRVLTGFEPILDFFSAEGNWIAKSKDWPPGNRVPLSILPLAPECSVLSFFYSVLAQEYDQAQKACPNRSRLHYLERWVRSLQSHPQIQHSIADFTQSFYKRSLEIENKPVLSWAERRKLLKPLWNERDRSLRAKLRTLNIRPYSPHAVAIRFEIVAKDLFQWFTRFWLRPLSHFKGWSYRYTIGVILWFVQTVRANIGYSLALAIYLPFTTFFITQPLNPLAMRLVGKVRDTSLAAFAVGSSILGTGQSSNDTNSQNVTGSEPQQPRLDLSQYRPVSAPFLTSGDVPPVAHQSWPDRMSQFKAMQIGYESRLVFATRMGRLEQLETQLTFPLMTESSWEEAKRYRTTLREIRLGKRGTPAQRNALLPLLAEEEKRVDAFMVYVWDKFQRFLLDHPYMVLDQDKDHAYTDFYLGRAMILFRNMTLELSELHPELKRIPQYKQIEKAALGFIRIQQPGKSVMDRLEKNSKVFERRALAGGTWDGQDLRSYMVRHWEILYLLQSKAQEASNYGLGSYTWSVRCMIWVLQSYLSNRNYELNLLLNSGATPAVKQEIRETLDPNYESLFYLAGMDYLSLQPEFEQSLGMDLENHQRQKILDTLQASLNDREKLLSIFF